MLVNVAPEFSSLSALWQTSGINCSECPGAKSDELDVQDFRRLAADDTGSMQGPISLEGEIKLHDPFVLKVKLTPPREAELGEAFEGEEPLEDEYPSSWGKNAGGGLGQESRGPLRPCVQFESEVEMGESPKLMAQTLSPLAVGFEGGRLAKNLGEIGEETPIEADFHAVTMAEPEPEESPANSTWPSQGVFQDPEAALDKTPSPVSHRWQPGAAVERLLDDISDIWIGAIVKATKDNHMYDIEYVDDGTLEVDVEDVELRPRRLRLDLPSEVWVFVGACLVDKQELCTFEAVGRQPRAASKQEEEAWWCSAYHERFGRCGPRCQFQRLAGFGDATAAAQSVANCTATLAEPESGRRRLALRQAVAKLGQTSADRTPWKARFIEQEQFTKPDRVLESVHTDAPGDAAYGVSGKRASYRGALDGYYFDGRLGIMVKD